MLYPQKIVFENSSDLIFNQIRTLNLSEVDTGLLSMKSTKDVYLKNIFYKLTEGKLTSIDTSFLNKEKYEYSNIVFYRFLKGDLAIDFNNGVQSDSIAYVNYIMAYDLATKKDDVILRCEALKKILKYHFKAKEDVLSFYEFAKIYKKLAYDLHESLYSEYYLLGSTIGIMYDLERSDLNPLPSALEALSLAEKNSKYYLAGRISQLIGVYYDIILNNISQARIFYLKAIQFYKKSPFYYSQKNRNDLSYNLSAIELESENYLLAVDLLKGIDLQQIPKRDAQDKVLIYGAYFQAYFNLQQLDSAIFYLNKKYFLKDSLDLLSRARDVKDIQTKYQTAEKEKQILVEQQRAVKNRNWFIAASLALLLSTGIAILLQKNSTKKRQLAEQEAILKQQRVENLLKEQELVSIDAMIAGQEKERQKVAGELHDDLGSLMATIKLHFDNAKVAKQDPALKNAQKLLEEAYQKIRGMAHSKYSGVMSDQGLLPAIKKMAKTITQTNALEVTVEDFGMGERLENSLELSIFRMVQELVANTIKHSEATKVNIQLTQHEGNLNIIVEDNGKGFDRTKLDKSKSGMGLTTIEKRVEHLEGTFTVDSVLGKGTSILIDLPV